jgi:serine/threonine protein kinase
MQSRYQIIGEINQGGVGVVLKAWDTKLSRHVAIKRFHSAEQRAAMGNIEGDLLKEASTLSAMHHPNIVSVYDVDMEGPDGPEVIMEYLNGQDLEHAVAQAALTLEDFYQVAQQTLDALSNAHRMNLLHRDIKPANIQVTWLANGNFVSKFVDFGLAKFFETPTRQTVRQDGTVMGSIYYMAPEQLERQPLDNRSDLYSLGCVFYYALTMHRPFEGATVMDVIQSHLHSRPVRLRDFRPNVPRDLELWIDWMTHRRPEQRPADADTALAALRQIMAGETPDAVPCARSASQRVVESPLRTGEVRLPKTNAFRTASKPQPSPAGHTRRQPVKSAVNARRRASHHGFKWAVGGGIAALLALAGLIALAGRKQGNPVVETGDAVNPAVLLDNAARATELERTKLELAAAHARLAVTEASAANSSYTPQNQNNLSQPPSAGLFMWFNAANHTFSDGQGTPTLPNGPVGQWRDLASQGGSAVLQYTASSTRDREQNFPTLRTAPAGAGLLKATPVVTFDGAGDTLCVRDRDGIGDEVGTAMDGGNLSVLMVYRGTGSDAPQGLMLLRGAGNRTILTLGIENQGLIAGPGSAPPLVIPGSETEFRIASCVLDAGAGCIHLGLISSDGQRASTDIRTSVEKEAHLEMIRMGTSDGSNTRERSMLAADVAEILIYNRALDRNARYAAENYLRNRFFGSAGPTVTSNTRR